MNWTVVENDPRRSGVGRPRARGIPCTSGVRVCPKWEWHALSYLNEYDLPGGPLGRIAGRAVAKVTEKELERLLRRLKSWSNNGYS